MNRRRNESMLYKKVKNQDALQYIYKCLVRLLIIGFVGMIILELIIARYIN